MPSERLAQILAALGREDGPASAQRWCQLCQQVLAVSGAGILLFSGDLPASLGTSNAVSAVVEELQFTLGEGPCLDAYHGNRVVLEPDLAEPRTVRWPAFASEVLRAGVRAVFAFPLRLGGARLGALDVYQDRPGPLSDDQHADALVLADLVAHAVLDLQADARPGTLAAGIEADSEFYLSVHRAAGAVSVQLGVTVAEALVRLRAFAFSHGRPIGEVAQDVISRTLRFDEGPQK